jgi:uncharacterized protein YabN with tetrapyrrole methylase and pyrophosphatase domain
MQPGTLTIVGTGIQLGQMSIEATSHIKEADRVLYLVTDPVTSGWIQDLNPNCESLERYYSKDKDRLTTYLEMAEHILSFVRKGETVCAAFYGHPGVFVLPSHVVVRRARQEGYHARMLPGVSAEDCLFCDLGVDPGVLGCQSFEATDFLVHRRSFDAESHLILWQIGVIGDIGYKERYGREGLKVLVEVLTGTYPPSHEVTVYEAARYAICEPSIVRVRIDALPDARITPISTLYVPPRRTTVPDLAMMRRLGIPESYLQRKADAVAAGVM